MDTAEKVYLFLDSFEGCTYERIRKCLSIYADETEFLRNFLIDGVKLLSILGEKLYNQMQECCNRAYLDALIQKYKSSGITPITLGSATYPQSLRKLKNPPFVLYAEGDLRLLDGNRMSVSGSRVVCANAAINVHAFCQRMAQAGVTIVAGLNDGCDASALEGALEAGGKCIAVLVGVGHVYPATHRALYERIQRNGLVVSELVARKPTFKDYLSRNRVVAGLGQVLFMPYAREDSGSLNTAEFSNRCGNPIFAFNGREGMPECFETRRLIEKNLVQGVDGVEPLLKKFGLDERVNWNETIKKQNDAYIDKKEGSKKTQNCLKPVDSGIDIGCTSISSKGTKKEIQREEIQREEKLVPRESRYDDQTMETEDITSLIEVFLEDREHTFHELLEQTGLAVNALNSVLFELELAEKIVRLPGNQYSKKITY